ncbi:PEP-CTERM sorting domain-containing protein [Poriferisphaera sp. WC338]|uniref:PEP-CTERM sorting domain-containing protein n=1 Tax=Poriferisphaera sp. WC338 TaxID=3425129 RepID=UPI003D814E08
MKTQSGIVALSLIFSGFLAGSTTIQADTIIGDESHGRAVELIYEQSTLKDFVELTDVATDAVGGLGKSSSILENVAGLDLITENRFVFEVKLPDLPTGATFQFAMLDLRVHQSAGSDLQLFFDIGNDGIATASEALIVRGSLSPDATIISGGSGENDVQRDVSLLLGAMYAGMSPGDDAWLRVVGIGSALGNSPSVELSDGVVFSSHTPNLVVGFDAPVPEPSGIILMGLGGAVMMIRRKKLHT